MGNSESPSDVLDTRLLNADQVADALNVAKSYVYQLMRTGVIPTVRLGKACRVRPQDLKDFIEANIHNQAGVN